MMIPDSTATRTLTIVLPESDWRALRTAEPDAIGWLHAQIRQRLNSDTAQSPSRSAAAGNTSNDSFWGDDDY